MKLKIIFIVQAEQEELVKPIHLFGLLFDHWCSFLIALDFLDVVMTFILFLLQATLELRLCYTIPESRA